MGMPRFKDGIRGRGRWCAAAAAMAASLAGAGAQEAGGGADAWRSAVAVRAAFEAQPPGTHTKGTYAGVMNGFRAIYHSDPDDPHAQRAAEQVAELLAEEGHEFHDPHYLREAAGQYEWIARAYPAGPVAPHALAEAIVLWGSPALTDGTAAQRAAAQLRSDYPGSAEAHELVDVGARNTAPPAVAATPQAGIVSPAKDHYVPPARRRSAEGSGDASSAGVLAAPSPAAASTVLARPRHAPVGGVTGPAVPPNNGEHYIPPSRRHAQPAAQPPSEEGPHAAAGSPTALQPVAGTAATEGTPGLALVSGIRHWSTASYTRVAIDLGDEVQYQAARVENPDRIFFDLHGARLAPALVGKSFKVTDDGFLTRIRAAQFSGDVTRVVLDVQDVADYSAFLLPNPYRLIIDIHGKPSAADRVAEERTPSAMAPAAAPVERPGASFAQAPEPGPRTPVGSMLPAMPVTDGSTGFGLPPRQASAARVAEPRVVIPSRPTAARPVPNAVATRTGDTGVDVAAVSDQPGKVEATLQPTSQPIVARSRESRVGSGHEGARRGSRVAHVDGVPAEPAPPTADGETSLVRALGLKIGRIVIDAGHGGHDSGTLGAGGIEEKDVVLDVALRLGKLLHDRLGAEIVYTRADDTFIPLETRTAIANKAQADLFISVHANSSPDPSARGVEVYYLNFTSDPDAMRVASRENAVSTQSVHELSDLVKQIALKDKIDESRELAADVDQSLYSGLQKGNGGLKNRGVKKAPFVVLIGANMPSVLAEISFVTNPTDAAELQRPAYRERVAESLYNGIARYAATLNTGRPAPGESEQAAAR